MFSACSGEEAGVGGGDTTLAVDALLRENRERGALLQSIAGNTSGLEGLAKFLVF